MPQSRAPYPAWGKINMNRHQRRKAKAVSGLHDYVHPEALQKLTNEVDRTACNSDRQYFIDHPQREFRLRSAWPAEISIEELLNGPARLGSRHYILVKQIARGVGRCQRVRFWCAKALPFIIESNHTKSIAQPLDQRLAQGWIGAILAHLLGWRPCYRLRIDW